jgi:hypothetical protein
MPLLLILGPVVGIAALVALVAHGHKGSATVRAKVLPPVSTQHIELDKGMPDVVVHQVLTALVHDQDPAQLEALAHQIAATYPLAASELQQRAAALGVAAAPSPTVSTAPSPSVSTMSGDAQGPDVSEPAKILQAAMRAYAQEPDPVSLDGFAQSIRERYPMAALMLTERAKEIRTALAQVAQGAPVQAAQAAPAGPAATSAPGSAGAIPAASPAGPPPSGMGGASGALAAGHASSLPASTQGALANPAGGVGATPPSGGMPVAGSAPARPATYVVQPGDSASVIAEQLTHDSRRWPELVAANVIKPTSPDGNFASLRAGETLMLPASWPAPYAAQVHP